MQAQLTRTRAKQIPVGADDVAQVEQAEELIIAVGNGVFFDIKLQARAILRDVHEARLAHAADGLDAAGDRDTRDLRQQFFGGRWR